MGRKFRLNGFEYKFIFNHCIYKVVLTTIGIWQGSYFILEAEKEFKGGISDVQAVKLFFCIENVISYTIKNAPS